jgi:putative DNA primase/helicase
MANSDDGGLDPRQDVTNRVIEALEKGVAPWQKPWNAAALLPMNPTSGRVYKGVNRLLLSLEPWGDNRWVTFQQALRQGWRVRKGEKGRGIIKMVELAPQESELGASAQPRDGAAEAARKRLVMRRYTVFNAEQLEGVPALEPSAPAFDPIEKAESLVAALKKTGLQISHAGAQAYYSPRADKIMIPERSAFVSVADLYGTLLHECGHASGHASRLNRDLSTPYGSEGYAKEEVIVELASAQLCAFTGVPISPAHIQSHANYVGSWLKILRADKTFIFKACKSADQIAEYMLGLESALAASAEHREWVQAYEGASVLERAPGGKQEPGMALEP